MSVGREEQSGWSQPRLYGQPMPMPGDGSALAVATSEPEGADTASWSIPIYHGPRRHRPRPPAGTTSLPASLPQPSADPGGSSSEPPPSDPFHPVPLTVTGDAIAAAEAEAAGGGRHSAGAPIDDANAPSLLASSRTMAIASMVSRATGFIRNAAIAATVGAGLHSVGDAYGIANTLPNMVYELLLGGVLTSVVIPVLVKAQQDDADRGEAYTQRLLSIAAATLAAGTLLAVLAAPWLVDIFGGPPQFKSLASLWATLLLPEIFFYGLGAMFAAVLNTRHVYGWPAWAPVANNVITILACLLFLLVPGPSALSTGNISNTQILVLGIGTTLGIAAQAMILLVPLRRTGFAWRWRFRASPNEAGRMAEFRDLALWVLGYVAISQAGVVVINKVAVHHGGVQIFANADLLFQVPYGILGVSLLTALMPRMSRAAARGDVDEVLDDLRLGARLSAVALLPITAGLIVLGPAFTSCILLGRFSEHDARLTGIALACAAFGLLPFALVMLQQRVFYAVRDARTPTLINLVMVAAKIVLVVLGAVLLHGDAIIVALSVSTSLSYAIGCVVGHVMLQRRFGLLGFRQVGPTVGWVAAASAAGAVVALVVVLAGDAALGVSRTASLLELILGAVLGGAVLVLVALRLPLPEVAQIAAAARGRTGRGGRSGRSGRGGGRNSGSA